jgi:uncharacterized protein YcbK (DUF882 family)
MQLTPHFSLAELTVTNTKLENRPSKEVIEVLRTTAFYMEKVREILGNVAITINSGYRSPDVNRAVGGTSNSSHTYGYAVDFTEEGECVINGFHTGDLFDVKNKLFLKRKIALNGNTWKT